jgi:signal transduction histidine kinase/ligand-binding sensor domain-containing protein
LISEFVVSVGVETAVFTHLFLRRFEPAAVGAFCLLIAFAPPLGVAGTNDLAIGQFVHTAWTVKDGVPADIRAIAQTTDGFLWLGTLQGLYRFDGVSFELYQPEFGPKFLGRSVSALLALPNGDLWIGFRDAGASLLRNGNCTNYSRSDGLPAGIIRTFVQDHDGVIWVGTVIGLARFKDGRWQEVGDDWGFSLDRLRTVYVDRHGTVWVGVHDTILFLPQGARRFQTTGISVGDIFQFAESPAGTLWMAEITRSVRPVPLPSNSHASQAEIQVGSAGILFDDVDGSLWITSVGDGMRRVLFPDQMNGQKIGEFSPAAERFTEKDGLSDDFSTCILKDREGSIWVGTQAGLDRFHRGAVVPLVLPGKFARKTLVQRDGGNIWLSSMGAVAWTDGYTWRDITSQFYFPRAVLDSRGAFWLMGPLTGRRRFFRLQEGKPSFVAETPAESSNFGQVFAEDRMGRLWLAGGAHQIFFLKNGNWGQLEMPPEIAGQVAWSSFTDSAGRVWFGFHNVILMIDGSNFRTFTTEDGIEAADITAINSLNNHIFIGGSAGLQVLEGDHFRSIASADGDRFDLVTGIEYDSKGDLFVSELRGIAFIPSSEISKVLQNPAAQVQEQVFDRRDGLAGATLGTPQFPNSLRGTDGRLWFSTTSGVSWIDPARMKRNLLPPPVAIRSVTADEKRYVFSSGLKLPPQIRRLTIDYTALSLAIPERVRFRYKLEGYDTDWQDAATRREAAYTNLSPRQYRFRVIACNNDSVWNESGASLDFSILPAWYQTVWFRSASVFCFALLLWMLYQLRLRQMERQYSIRSEERVSERTRIARDLHDTLLQRLHGLMFEFQAARNMFQKRPQEALLTLDDAIVGTERAITESQEAIEDLRGDVVADNDLAQLLRETGEELVAARGADHDSPTFGLTVEGERRNLVPTIREGVFRIVREVVRNAFRHAQAHRIEADILYGDHQFRVRVRDDGKGMDSQVLEKGSRAGHWGLPGVRERARQIGAKLDFWSEAGAGTEVQLAVAASVAYEKSPDRSSFRLFRRRQNHEHRS